MHVAAMHSRMCEFLDFLELTNKIRAISSTLQQQHENAVW